MKFFWVSEDKKSKNDFVDSEIEVENSNIVEEEEGQVALDIIENSNEIIIISPIAWVSLDHIDISLKDDILTISWEREKLEELYSNDSKIRVEEAFWGKFSRNIILPDNTNLDEIKAVLEKNILIVRIPKLKFKGQSIEIEETEKTEDFF